MSTWITLPCSHGALGSPAAAARQRELVTLTNLYDVEMPRQACMPLLADGHMTLLGYDSSCNPRTHAWGCKNSSYGGTMHKVQDGCSCHSHTRMYGHVWPIDQPCPSYAQHSGALLVQEHWVLGMHICIAQDVSRSIFANEEPCLKTVRPR